VSDPCMHFRNEPLGFDPSDVRATVRVGKNICKPSFIYIYI
jgi:hypothetical protein